MKSSSIVPHEAFMDRHPITRQVVGLAAWLAVSFAAGAIGGLGSAQSASFYEQLARPDWAPPAWLFAPVWGVLYLLMGVGAWLVWKAGGFDRSGGALLLFIIQLGLNAIWPWLFFAWRLGAWACAEILLLWCVVLAMAGLFWRVRKLAGALLVPYLAWVTFATVLCLEIWKKNPALLGH